MITELSFTFNVVCLLLPKFRGLAIKIKTRNTPVQTREDHTSADIDFLTICTKGNLRTLEYLIIHLLEKP